MSEERRQPPFNSETLPGIQYRLVVIAEQQVGENQVVRSQNDLDQFSPFDADGAREIINQVRRRYENQGRSRTTAKISTATRPRRRAPLPPTPPPPLMCARYEQRPVCYMCVEELEKRNIWEWCPLCRFNKQTMKRQKSVLRTKRPFSMTIKKSKKKKKKYEIRTELLILKRWWQLISSKLRLLRRYTRVWIYTPSRHDIKKEINALAVLSGLRLFHHYQATLSNVNQISMFG